MSILVIRHGQQIMNSNSPDMPLITTDPSSLPTLNDFYFDRDIIISSPYLRCRQTANMLIAASQLKNNNYPTPTLYYDLRLSESQHHRRKPLQLRSDTQLLIQQIIQDQGLDPATKIPDSDETWAEFQQRVVSFYSNLMSLLYDQPKRHNVLVVTHGAIVKYWSDLVGGPHYNRGNAVPHLSGFILPY